MRLAWLLACTATLFTHAEARYGPLVHESAQHAEQPPSSFSYREQKQLPLPLAHDAKKELLHLHRKLVQIESITGNEYEVGTWLAPYLESHNLTVEKLEVAPNRFNVFAYPGTENKMKVLVSSHIDTVRLSLLPVPSFYPCGQLLTVPLSPVGPPLHTLHPSQPRHRALGPRLRRRQSLRRRANHRRTQHLQKSCRRC